MLEEEEEDEDFRESEVLKLKSEFQVLKKVLSSFNQGKWSVELSSLLLEMS